MTTPDNDNPHLETLIVSRECRGKGTEDDPCRRVLQIHSTEGEFMAEKDSFNPFWQILAAKDERIMNLEQCIANYEATVEELQAELRMAVAAAQLRKKARK